LERLTKVILYDRGVQPVARGPKVARELKFSGPQKVPDVKANVTFFEGYC